MATACVILRLLVQQKLHQNGICLSHQHDIHIRLQPIVLFLRNIFKRHHYNQFLAISAASEEIMLFHDYGFIMLRLAYSCYLPSTDGRSCDVVHDWNVGCKC